MLYEKEKVAAGRHFDLGKKKINIQPVASKTPRQI